MSDLTSEQYTQMISLLSTRHANEIAQKDVTIAELQVRLAAATQGETGAAEQGESDAA